MACWLLVEATVVLSFASGLVQTQVEFLAKDGLYEELSTAVTILQNAILSKPRPGITGSQPIKSGLARILFERSILPSTWVVPWFASPSPLFYCWRKRFAGVGPRIGDNQGSLKLIIELYTVIDIFSE